MKKITNMADILKMLNDAIAYKRLKYESHIPDYELGKFTEGYCRYFGCGHNLYLLVNESLTVEQENAMQDICRQRTNPSMMEPQLEKILNEFRLVMFDFEIGGIYVYGDKLDGVEI